MGDPVRRVASMGLAVALAAGLWALFSGYPGPVDAPSRVAGGARPKGIHAYERATVPGSDPSGCRRCHPAAAHLRSTLTRAFLNLHRQGLECGVCHLSGRGLAVRRFRGDEEVTRATLADGRDPGRLKAARRAGDRWVPVTGPGGGVRLNPTGPPCGDCHRRGSPILSVPGNFDRYRIRLLEDLSVLRRLPETMR